jgi:serine/threonine protein phosphatase PrpC
VCPHFAVVAVAIDGLAGHLLGEFASMYLNEDKKSVTKEQQSHLLESLLYLNLATSNYTTNFMASTNVTAYDALQDSLVGTEK